MNIERISDSFVSVPLGRVNHPEAPKSQMPPNAVVQGDDQADMSKLSTLMARSVEEIKSHLVARQDKVEQFRDELDTPPNPSDEVIDTIWRRMLGH